MKPIVKNILIGGAIFLIGASFWAKEKIDRTLAVFDKISIKPYSLPKNIELGNPNKIGIPQEVSFLIDIIIINPAVESLSVTGLGVATLDSVDIYFKNFLIGTADLKLDEIDIPPQSNFIIQNVRFVGKTLSILSNISEFENAKITDFKFLSRIDIIGNTYEIGS
jgi:hypothetical protein